MADLRSFLSTEDLYVVTANAFPYGPFKNRLVMETVFEPDWRERRRAEYTKGVATILSSLAGDGVSPTIQTAPLGFKPHVTAGVVERFTDGLLGVVAHLVEIARETGTRVRLGLEPEPFCLLETTDEAIGYFRDELFTDAAAARLATLAGIDADDAAIALRDHLGVVFDICHQAVEFEDIGASLDALVAAEIPIVKLQVAAAMRIPVVTPEIVEQLGQFTDTVYLSQTMERRGDGPIRRFLNLRDALTCWEPGGAATEWRTHFHVPVFLDDLGGLGTTRFAIAEALAKHRATPLSDQVEIETYTWDVLPAQFKTGDIVEYLERALLGTRPAWSTRVTTGRAGTVGGSIWSLCFSISRMWVTKRAAAIDRLHMD